MASSGSAAVQTTSGSAAAGLPSPPQIPDHELIRKIGGGSYGEVWLARNTLGTLRAVKIVYRHVFEDNRPFDREFRGIQRFEPISRTHEGLVDILQVGRAEDYFYYVMELADPAQIGGEVRRSETGDRASEVLTAPQLPTPNSQLLEYEPRTLRADLKSKGRLPTAECVALGLGLARALAHLHSHSLVHRDVKPSNIIFVGSVPKLADIGLVADISDARSFVGTEGFIPPEGPGTPQADVYGLGKVLYEAATGNDRRDFPHVPLPLAEEEELLELNAVILKACKNEPAERYRTVEEMAADLDVLRLGQSVRRRRTWRRRVVLLTKAALVLSVLAAIILFVPALNWRRNPPITASSHPISIAVFPFRSSGSDAEHNELCERMAEDLTVALGMVPGFQPVRRKWAYTLTPEHPDPGRFKLELRLQKSVLVRLRQNASNPQMEVRLIEADDSGLIWTDARAISVRTLADREWEIVEALVAALGSNIAADDESLIRQRLFDRAAAWQSVLAARGVYPSNAVATTRMIELYNRAIEQDPECIPAYLGLAYVYREMSDLWLPPRHAMPEMKRCTLRALEIDETNPTALHHLAVIKMVFDWDWDEAERLFRQQADLTGEPNGSYAVFLESRGRFDEALAIWRACETKYRDSRFVRYGIMNHFLQRRDYARALQEAEAKAAEHTDWRGGCLALARCREALGLYDEALDAIRQAQAIAEGPDTTAIEGHILGAMGNTTGAHDTLAKLNQISRLRYVPPAFKAFVYVSLGDRESAFECLGQAFTDRSECLVLSQYYGLRTDRYWDPLRDDPRFDELLTKVGLPTVRSTLTSIHSAPAIE